MRPKIGSNTVVVTVLLPIFRIVDVDNNNNKHFQVYSIDVTMPGVHTVMVNSRTETRAKVAAISGIDLQHGFSKFQLSSIVDTSSRPAPGK